MKIVIAQKQCLTHRVVRGGSFIAFCCGSTVCDSVYVSADAPGGSLHLTNIILNLKRDKHLHNIMELLFNGQMKKSITHRRKIRNIRIKTILKHFDTEMI